MSEPFRNLSAEMHPQRSPASVEEHLKVTTSLRGLYDAEGIFLTGHGKIESIIRRYLQKHAVISAALVSLACRMQKSRAKSETSCIAIRLQNFLADGLQQ